MNRRQAIGFILLCLVKDIIFGQISNLCTQCTFKNIKVKAPNKYHNENTQP